MSRASALAWVQLALEPGILAQRAAQPALGRDLLGGRAHGGAGPAFGLGLVEQPLAHVLRQRGGRVVHVECQPCSPANWRIGLCGGDILAQVSRAFADDGGGLGEGGEGAVGARGPIADAPLDIGGPLLAREARSDLAPVRRLDRRRQVEAGALAPAAFALVAFARVPHDAEIDGLAHAGRAEGW